MRTIILLTILAVLPISCKFYLYRQFAQGENALEIAQKLMDTVRLGLETKNADLCLSVFHKNVRFEHCGYVLTYENLEASIRNWHTSRPVPDFNVTKAVIEGNLLTFETVEKRTTDKVFVTAVRNGTDFKITTMYDNDNCKPDRLYLQEDVGEYIY